MVNLDEISGYIWESTTEALPLALENTLPCLHLHIPVVKFISKSLYLYLVTLFTKQQQKTIVANGKRQLKKRPCPIVIM